MPIHNKVAPDLFLHHLPISTAPGDPPTDPSTGIHHILVVDCSGSMAGQLGLIRDAIKRKIPQLMRETDVLSVLWFSGRQQCGILFEATPVTLLHELAQVTTAIDHQLIPRGLTGFVEPLDAVGQILNRNPQHRSATLCFMSDGMDNQWSRSEITHSATRLAPQLAASTIVEYGDYADRAMLAHLAACTGGQLIHCASFAHYEPVLIHAVTQHAPATRREVAVPRHALGGFAFEITEAGDLLSHDAQHGQAWVRPETRALWYLGTQPDGVAAHDTAPLPRCMPRWRCSRPVCNPASSTPCSDTPETPG